MSGFQATGNKAAKLALTAAPQILVIAMLLWALVPGNPYGYYMLLRWVCCGVFAYLAFQAFESKYQGWVWILGITAGVYNPIIPVHLTREIWLVVNVVTIGIAVGTMCDFTLKDDETSRSDGMVWLDNRSVRFVNADKDTSL